MYTVSFDSRRRKVPIPYSPAIHGISADYLLQFEYIQIVPEESSETYLLMLRDDQ